MREADRENLFIKIPGTTEGLDAIEETIYKGTPVNVTLLFDADQYIAQAEAYMRGIERRVAEGLDPKVGSVASVFVSRWDVAVADEVGDELKNRLGIAAAVDGYVAYRRLIESDRWLRLAERGRAAAALPLRLDRDQGPGSAEDDLRRGVRRAALGRHDARGHAARPARGGQRTAT